MSECANGIYGASKGFADYKLLVDETGVGFWGFWTVGGLVVSGALRLDAPPKSNNNAFPVVITCSLALLPSSKQSRKPYKKQVALSRSIQSARNPEFAQRSSEPC